MGLDLLCRGVHERVGSYHSVHAQRAHMMRAYVLYLRERKSNHQHELDRALEEVEHRRLAHKVEKAIQKDRPDYDMIYKLQKKIHKGLLAFVYHSDCDGVWTPEEADEILDLLTRLRPFFSRIAELAEDCDEETGRHYLEKILRVSIHHRAIIRFL